jgi:hypothetical protein
LVLNRSEVVFEAKVMFFVRDSDAEMMDAKSDAQLVDAN